MKFVMISNSQLEMKIRIRAVVLIIRIINLNNRKKLKIFQKNQVKVQSAFTLLSQKLTIDTFMI